MTATSNDASGKTFFVSASGTPLSFLRHTHHAKRDWGADIAYLQSDFGISIRAGRVHRRFCRALVWNAKLVNMLTCAEFNVDASS